ncbi:uncharacterized protein LOC125863985 [Solanum stenotomum]|uniref:uncharacterized protein LOC125863985 n=1 Tax=Solanum stenotomum TaxID=172797 RepID=UPI0020D063C7|nr:uncharacterized protein LOC125863985 [Solanum stenotomum]
MEGDQDLKFVCKWCNKKYPCGKSLGGHIKSHAVDEKFETAKLKKMESWNISSGKNQSSGIPSGYVLRENPKKTWRVEADSNLYCSDSPKIMTHNPTFEESDMQLNTAPLPQERVCQQCGKCFPSMKALCGHMACHSEKDKGSLKYDDDDDDDNSWTSSDHSHSDTEAGELISQSYRSKTTKRYNKIVVKSNNYYCSSSVFEIDQVQEQEELAKCLIMLSRDSRSWNGVNSLVETSDNNSAILETKPSSSDLRNNARKNGVKRVYNQDEKLRMKKEGDRITKVDMLEAETQSENSDSDYYLGQNGNVESDGSVERFVGNGKGKWSTSKMSFQAWLDEHRMDEKKGIRRIKQYITESSKDLGKKFERDGYGLASNSYICESKKRMTDRYNDLEIRNDSKKMKFGVKSPEGYKNDIHKTRKYECLNCKKVFSSYQALGGHRPCHKKVHDYSESTYETGENSVGADHNDPKCTKIGKYRDVFRNKKQVVPSQDLPYEPEKKIKPKKSKGHKCPFCYRMFKSGQALGGHKRSHFINGGDQENFNQQSSAVKSEVADLLDLNLPAPVDEEDEEHARFMSW